MDKLEVQKITRKKKLSKKDLEMLGLKFLEVQEELQNLIDLDASYSGPTNILPQLRKILVDHGVIV